MCRINSSHLLSLWISSERAKDNSVGQIVIVMVMFFMCVCVFVFLFFCNLFFRFFDCLLLASISAPKSLLRGLGACLLRDIFAYALSELGCVSVISTGRCPVLSSFRALPYMLFLKDVSSKLISSTFFMD